MNEMNNRFGLPNLEEIYQKVCAYVKEHQGELGYICTWEENEGGSPWAMCYTGRDCDYFETEIQAVRVKDDKLQILLRSWESIEEREEVDWSNVKYDDFVVFLNTLFSIAEEIECWVD